MLQESKKLNETVYFLSEGKSTQGTQNIIKP